MKNTAVSVIVPVYNVASYLEETLDSLVNQSLKNIEIICVDDCSTDGSDEIVRLFSKRDDRIKTLYHDTRLFTSQARKDGVAISTGKYVMFLDGDDEFTPDACEKAFNAIEKYNTSMVQFGLKAVNDPANFGNDLQGLENWHAPYIERIDEDLVSSCFVKNRFSFSLVNKIYNGDLCREAFNLLEDGEFCNGEDLYAFFVIAALSKSSMGIGEKLYIYHFGRGVYGKDKISLESYDRILTQANVYQAMRKFCLSTNDTLKLEIVEKVVKPHFLNECVEKWFSVLSPDIVKDGYDHLIDAWGNDEILQIMSERGDSDRLLKLSKHMSDSAFSSKLETLSRQIQVIATGRLLDESVLDETLSDGSSPKISVIIPVYNVEQYLRECLDSAINQTLEDIEIICVDDGSTDSSCQILTEYAQKDSRITVLHKKNGGLSSARNFGLNKARGRYIQFLDSDDLLAENALMTEYQYAVYFELDLLFSEAELFYETEELKDKGIEDPDYYCRHGAYPYTESGKDLFKRMMEVNEFIVPVYLYLVKRDFIENNHLSFCEGMVHEDDLFTLQSISLAERTRVLVGNKIYLRRLREGSIITDDNHLRRAYGCFKIVYEMKKFIQSFNLYRDESFYKDLIQWLFVECDSCLNELSEMDLIKIWDFAMELNSDERNDFLLYIYQKRADRDRAETNFYSPGISRIARYSDIRIDLKNIGTKNNDLVFENLSDLEVQIETASWITDETGHGYYMFIDSYDKEKTFSARFICSGSGTLQIGLLGDNVEGEDGKRIPYWIDVLDFSINGERILSKPVVVWHDRPYRYEMPVENGQIVNLQIIFKPHSEGKLIDGSYKTKCSELRSKFSFLKKYPFVEAAWNLLQTAKRKFS